MSKSLKVFDGVTGNVTDSVFYEITSILEKMTVLDEWEHQGFVETHYTDDCLNVYELWYDVRTPDDGDKESYLYGFRHVPAFFSDTEG